MELPWSLPWPGAWPWGSEIPEVLWGQNGLTVFVILAATAFGGLGSLIHKERERLRARRLCRRALWRGGCAGGAA